jgi:hypothetical protein
VGGDIKKRGHMLRPWNNSTQWSQTFENVFKFWRERKNYVNVRYGAYISIYAEYFALLIKK